MPALGGLELYLEQGSAKASCERPGSQHVSGRGQAGSAASTQSYPSRSARRRGGMEVWLRAREPSLLDTHV